MHNAWGRSPQEEEPPDGVDRERDDGAHEAHEGDDEPAEPEERGEEVAQRGPEEVDRGRGAREGRAQAEVVVLEHPQLRVPR